MPNFWACFASAAMASSLACVLGAPPLRASSIAASHFAHLSNATLPSAKEWYWLYTPSTSRTLWFSARSATKRSTPSAAMWVRAVRRMSCTVKCSMSSSGRRSNATFSVSGLMWPKRFRLGTPPFMWISRRGGNRYSLLHENTWTSSSHRRTGAASGMSMDWFIFVRDGCSDQTPRSRSNSVHRADSNSIFRTHRASSSHTASSFWRPKLGVSCMALANAATPSRFSQRCLEPSKPPAFGDLEARDRVGIDPAALHGEVEHAEEVAQRIVGHGRRACIEDAGEHLGDVQRPDLRHAQLADRRLDVAADDAKHDLGVFVGLGDVAVVPGLREGGHGDLLMGLEPLCALLGGHLHPLLDACPALARRFTGVLERQVWVAAEHLLSGAAAEAVAKNPGSLALECSGGGGNEGQASTDATVHGAGVEPGPQRLVGDAFSLSHSAISTAIYEEPVG